MKRILPVLILILLLAGCKREVRIVTTWPSDGTPGNIQSIHDTKAQNGDTITLPTGTFIWATGVTLSKAITLQGAGISSTIILDNIQSQNIGLIVWDIRGTSNARARLTGIGFENGGRPASTYNGVIHVGGSNTNGSTFRLDNCKFTALRGTLDFNTVIGVIDHNTFVFDVSISNASFHFWGSNWNGGTLGDGSWAAPLTYGDSQWLFIEDNTFVNSNTTYTAFVTDAYDGARFVFRHNTVGGGNITNHGTESSGRGRGCRAMDIYSNTMNGQNLNSILGGSRGGGCLFHDNTINDYWTGAAFSLINNRNNAVFQPWGGADGTNVWDVNDPKTFFTGSAAANSSGTTVTVSGTTWAVNQWAGYSVRRTSNLCNVTSTSFGEIMSNTANTLSYGNGGGWGGGTLAFCAGDTLEIRRCIQALDQPGRGRGSLIIGTPPVVPAGWNDQVTEPCYSWNNSGKNHSGTSEKMNFASQMPSIRAGEHYFNDTAMPGYTPYTYPHPLVSGGPVQSPAPTATSIPVSPTATARSSPTATPTPSPSSTSTPTPTATATPTQTIPPPTSTATPTVTPTAVPTATPTATVISSPTPSSNLCDVPNLIGTKIKDAQKVWDQAGFRTQIIVTSGAPGHQIASQSVDAGSLQNCNSTIIRVSN